MLPLPGHTELIEFAKEVCRVAFEGCDLSGGEIQELGVKHGVLAIEKFDAVRHATVFNAEDFEAGDAVYVFAGPLAPTAPQPATQAGWREALETARNAIENAQEELRMIRMKDSGAIYDTLLRRLTLPLAIEKIDKALSAAAPVPTDQAAPAVEEKP